MNPRWQVSFKGGLTEDAKDELAQLGAVLVAQRLRLGTHGEQPLGATVWIRAADGDEAIASLKAALSPYGSFSDFVAVPVNYAMYLGFLESEREALEAVTHEIGLEDPRVSMVVIHEPSKGSAELLLELPADSRQGAVEQARALYADLRRRAGLEPAEPLYGFLGPTGQFPSIPVGELPRHAELAQRAQQLFDNGMLDYAVVAAQTACELLVFDAVTQLMVAQGESASANFARHWFDTSSQTQSLTDDRLQRLWTFLTGDKVQGQPWWDGYKKHIGRRHGIVHRGYEPPLNEASESLKATEDFRAHIAATLSAALSVENT